MVNTVLRVENISKSFPGVKALKSVSIEFQAGEVHALLGENGAGKSTLLKCLAGLYQPDEGAILLNGQERHFSGPVEAFACGISLIHQELAMCEKMTVVDNMFLGSELMRNGTLDRKRMNQICAEVLASVGAAFTPDAVVSSLSTADKQLLEIARALKRNSQVLIMDEPTAALSEREVDMVFAIINRLRDEGRTIIYVSHRMDEIFSIADRITVLRDGQSMGTVRKDEATMDMLIRMMVGYDLSQYYTKRGAAVSQEVVLEAKDISRYDGRVKNASFCLRKGEIIGFCGLVGSGRTELMEVLFGLEKKSAGEIRVKGKLCSISRPEEAIAYGISLIPEDRKLTGLFLNHEIGFNIMITVLDKFIKGFKIDRATERRIIYDSYRKLDIKAASPKVKAGSLSGGNQQKIVIAKWLAREADILLMDEPTKGIDIGAKSEIYALMEELTGEGKSIIMVSSELTEVLNMSDRLYIMSNGAIVACLEKGAGYDQEEVLKYSMGVNS